LSSERLIRALPKAELHVHLIGSIRPETLLDIVEEEGLEAPFRSMKDVRELFKYRDFPHFISIYTLVNDCIVDERYFERITYELLEDEARCNVRYVEISFSPRDHTRRGLDYGEMLDAMNRARRRGRRELGIESHIRVDLVRNYGPEAAMETLDLVESKGEGVVSVDIGGSEDRFPPKPFAPVYRRAREMGLHLVAHAGEAAGPESIWDAVRHLGVERIGHGVAAIRDRELMKCLKELDIAVEACPTSNILIGIVPSLEEHPIRGFYDYGLRVSANTDDPSMFDTDMNREYLRLHRHLGFTVEELLKLSLTAVGSSFLPEDERRGMREHFLKEYEHLMETVG
jgi:adenosine deaminase